jgi:hypothetical protein
VDSFEAVLRDQVADARRQLAAARQARDYDGIKSYGLRLQYLLEIAEEYRVALSEEPDSGAGPVDPGGV